MTIQIGFLLFPRIQQLDLTGPYEMLASVPGAVMHLAAKTLDPVQSVTGLTLQPTTTLDACPALDVICVPGGVGVNPLLQDEAVLEFVRRQAGQARYVTSVCTGALILGAAGLLHGRRATTHWSAHDLLARFGAIPTQGRVVRDGSLFTGGGVTAGIDFGLTLAAELTEDAQAQAIQLMLEYAPEPPFAAGTPFTAPPAVLAQVRARGAAMRQEREDILTAIGV